MAVTETTNNIPQGGTHRDTVGTTTVPVRTSSQQRGFHSNRGRQPAWGFSSPELNEMYFTKQL